MKQFLGLLLAVGLLASEAQAYLTTSVTPHYPLSASKAMVTDENGYFNSSAVTATELGYVSGVTSAIQTQITANGSAITALQSQALSGTFERTCQITSAAGATAVHCLTDADVGAGKSAYLTGFQAKVNGSTVWATTATCAIQDTNGTPLNFVTFAVADMTANAIFFPGVGAATTYGNAYMLGTGSTATKGLDLKCNANGTGSTFVVTLTGVIK